MKVQIEAWKLLDWQGPSSGVRFRVTANDSFLARDDDNTGVEVDASPKVFREVDCVVATETIDGIPVKTITIPALWLFSTTDAIHNRTARYSAKFVTNRGGDIKQLDLLQNFQLPAHILDVFNPVPWAEIIRYNFPAAPVPIDRTTFSTEQILELIGGGSVNPGGNSGNSRIAFWSGPITVDGAVGFTWQTIDSGAPALNLIPPAITFNAFRIAEGAGNANVKVGGSPALFSTHLTDESGLFHRALSNDTATRRWTEGVRDGALGLQYNAYDNSDILQGSAIFDPAGGVGVADSAAGFGYLYKASAAYHLGINAAGAGIGAATKEITFTTSGVGINKATAIGAQLHVVSGDAGRIGFIVDSAGSPTQPLAQFRNNTGVRFSFNHDAVATFGLASSVKGRLSLAAAVNSNIQSIEAADTPASTILYKLPAANPANGQLLRTVTFSGGIATLEWVNPTAGGDVSSSIGTTVDNRLTRFDGTTGKLIQDSAVVVADTTGAFTVPDGWSIADAGGVSITLNQFTQVFASPTGSNAGPLFSFTAALQTQSSGVGTIKQISTTYNQTSTAGSTDFNIVRTETALGSGQHNFLRGVSGAAGTTLRFRIDNLGNYFFGALSGNFIGDSNGNEVLRITGVASAINELEMLNAPIGVAPIFRAVGGDTNIPVQITAKGTEYVTMSPFAKVLDTQFPNIRFMRTNATARTIDLGIDGSDNFGVFIPAGAQPLLIAMATGVTTFSAIPVLPASDPTTDNQATRKIYVDTRRMRWAISFYIPNIGTRGVDADFSEIQGAQIPGSNFIATAINVKAIHGSAAGAWIVDFRKQPAGSISQTTLGSINWNSGLGATIGVQLGTAITPHNFTEDDWVYPVVSTYASGDQAVWLAIKGYHTTQNP